MQKEGEYSQESLVNIVLLASALESGSALVADAYAHVRFFVDSKYQIDTSQHEEFENWVRWARKKAVERGLLEPAYGANKGKWKLTSEGLRVLACWAHFKILNVQSLNEPQGSLPI